MTLESYVQDPGRTNILKEMNDLGLLDTIPTADLLFVKLPSFQFWAVVAAFPGEDIEGRWQVDQV